MKVLVTGATGFVGSRVVRELLEINNKNNNNGDNKTNNKKYEVMGLCRSQEQADHLKSIDVEPIFGTFLFLIVIIIHYS